MSCPSSTASSGPPWFDSRKVARCWSPALPRGLRRAAGGGGPAVAIGGVVPIAPAGLDMAGWFGVIEGEWMVRAVLGSPLPLPRAVVRSAVAQVYRQVAFSSPRGIDPRLIASFASHLSRTSDVSRILASGRRLIRS